MRVLMLGIWLVIIWSSVLALGVDVSPTKPISQAEETDRERLVKQYMDYRKEQKDNHALFVKNSPDRDKYDMNDPEKRAIYEQLRRAAFLKYEIGTPALENSFQFKASDIVFFRKYTDDPLLRDVAYMQIRKCSLKSEDILLQQKFIDEMLVFILDPDSDIQEIALNLISKDFKSDSFSPESRVKIADYLRFCYKNFMKSGVETQNEESSEPRRQLLSSIRLSGISKSVESVPVLKMIIRVDGAFFIDENGGWKKMPDCLSDYGKEGLWVKTVAWPSLVAMAQIGDKDAVSFIIRLIDGHPNQMGIAKTLFRVIKEIKQPIIAQYFFDRVPMVNPPGNLPPVEVYNDPSRLSYGDWAFFSLFSLVSEDDQKKWWGNNITSTTKIKENKVRFLEAVKGLDDLTLDLR